MLSLTPFPKQLQNQALYKYFHIKGFFFLQIKISPESRLQRCPRAPARYSSKEWNISASSQPGLQLELVKERAGGSLSHILKRLGSLKPGSALQQAHPNISSQSWFPWRSIPTSHPSTTLSWGDSLMSPIVCSVCAVRSVLYLWGWFPEKREGKRQ